MIPPFGIGVTRLTIELTILQQNDTHGQILSHPELFYHNSSPLFREVGGLPRMAQLVKEIRRRRQNVLFFDGGDVFHGTAPLVLSKGDAMIPILNQMGLDAWVPGNWDFAYGPTRLQDLVAALQFPTVAANVSLFTPYQILEVATLRIGIIGLTYPYVDDTMPPAFSEGLTFILGVNELQQHIDILRHQEHANLIVVLSHMGLPLDVHLASQVSSIDVLLSAHTHDRVTSPIVQNGTIIVQSGASSSFLGELVLNIDKSSPQQAMVVDFRYQLHPLFADQVAEDPSVKETVQQAVAPYLQELERVIGSVGTPLHRMTLQQAPMDTLITDAYLAYTGADLAFSHGWRYGVPILPGSVTMWDMYNIIPTNPELFTMEVDGATILHTLEINLEQVYAPNPFQQKGGYVLRSSGLFMAYKPNNPKGHRIEHIEIQGKSLHRNKLYTVAGAGKQLFKNKQDRKMLQTHSIDVISEYLSKHPALHVDDTQRVITI